MNLSPGVTGDATVSDCGQYRYSLERRWEPGSLELPRGTAHLAAAPQPEDAVCLWIMLNPSTAGADEDDATARKIQGFTNLWGFSALAVVNLFALRADKPGPLYRHPDPVGPGNTAWIEWWLHHPDVGRVVEAWGVHGEHQRRGARVHRLVAASRHRVVWRLLTTSGGEPGHPLYIPYDCRSLEAVAL